MLIPCYAMTLEQFARQVIAIVVTPVMGEGGKVRLVPSTAEAERAMLEFQQEFMRAGQEAAIPDVEIATWASRKIDELLACAFDDDVWYSRIPDGRPVLLVKEHCASTHGMQEVVRRTHLNEVLDAARSSLEIPQAVASEYARELRQMFAQRNLPFP